MPVCNISPEESMVLYGMVQLHCCQSTDFDFQSWRSRLFLSFEILKLSDAESSISQPDSVAHRVARPLVLVKLCHFLPEEHLFLSVDLSKPD